MQPLQHFIEFVIHEIGIDATRQAIFDAAHCDPDSPCAKDLYAAFCAVKQEKEKQKQQQEWMDEEMSRLWTL